MAYRVSPLHVHPSGHHLPECEGKLQLDAGALTVVLYVAVPYATGSCDLFSCFAHVN